MDLFFFYAFSILILGGAAFTISLRNPVHCAVSLLVSLTGVAGLFLLEQADFLFAAQLIVYIGGVVLLFLFVIMLVRLDRVRSEKRFPAWWPIGLATALAIALALGRSLIHSVLPPGSSQLPRLNTEALGDLLLTDYLLPFEVVSILLLAALVGAVTLARGEA